MSKKSRDSLERFRLKKVLSSLSSKEGRHTELISLYVPSDRQISDVMNALRQEYGTASNIKSKSTRKNVTDAIERVMQRLKLFKSTPENGLVIFCGAIPQNGAGSEKIETYVLEPPNPISIYYYRCDQRFHLQPLMEMVKEKDVYGIVSLDGNEATIATLRGRSLEIVKNVTSGLPGKHRAGGQSQRRFERLREMEVNEYFKRVGRYIDEIFLNIPDLKGMVLGGPGYTKDNFLKGEYINYVLKERVLATVDTSYTGENGVEQIVEKSSEIFEEVGYFEEKKAVQEFLYQLGHVTGLATYGEDEVRRSLKMGAVDKLLLSEELDEGRVSVICSNCSYSRNQTIKFSNLPKFEEDLADKQCPKCSYVSLEVVEVRNVVEELADLADQTGAEVEIISTQTEEGVELNASFGGIAGILRYSIE